MDPLYPEDLRGWDPNRVGRELFGVDPLDDPWWSLDRIGEDSFKWVDHRLGTDLLATHGFLVALHEVSTRKQAQQFAAQNKILLLEDGGLFLRSKGIAELFIRCGGLAPKETIQGEDELYRLSTNLGNVITVGYGSLLFTRLVAGPEEEANPSLQDIETLTTLVIHDIEKDEVAAYAEMALFHLRRSFKGLQFGFWRLPDLLQAPRLREIEEEPDPPCLVDNVKIAEKSEAVVFFNRARESEPVAGFLYFYRVLEACFDYVLNSEVDNWRGDQALSSVQLLRKIRDLQRKGEDRWALSEVLSRILNQQQLDKAHKEGLVADPSAEQLSAAIYRRRNSIAHGRKGDHSEILVPYGFSLSGGGHTDRAWYELLGELAMCALEKWILL